MTLSPRAKIFLLGLGDLAALYLSLFAALLIRYGALWRAELIDHHLKPFTIIFALWLAVFYVAGLYDLRRLRNNLEFLKNLGLTIAVNAGGAIMFFYLIPTFGITPKTNLFIFLAIFTIVAIIWRRAFNRWTELSSPLAYVTLVGESQAMKELYVFLENNPQLGFKIHAWIKEDVLARGGEGVRILKEHMQDSPSTIVVVLRDVKRDVSFGKVLYEFFTEGRSVHDVPSFYEEIFRKIPVDEITEEWFFDHIAGHHRFYDNLKNAFERLMALVLLVALSPILLLIALLVSFTSREPVMCKQIRIGKRGASYIHYKFRTMQSCNEKNGAAWKQGGNRDPRLTWAGRFLAPSHLDELPQLLNIIKGELSFVGPRPERPEFVKLLRENIPYYDIRHLVKPGITGWAQINYRYGSSVEDAAEKLRYDLYYIKNRSLVIDIAIVLKTLKTLFSNPE